MSAKSAEDADDGEEDAGAVWWWCLGNYFALCQILNSQLFTSHACCEFAWLCTRMPQPHSPSSYPVQSTL